MRQKRIVVKVGTNVLTRPDGHLDVTRMSAIVDQLVWLRAQGFAVVLVTSGAVAAGRGEIASQGLGLDSVEQRQLFSAVGQVKLLNLYHNLLRNYGVVTGQILTMKENFSTDRERANLAQCLEVMLAHAVLPIVNENDTVCITELMFTDNDELSGLMAELIGASTLVILSNIDGLFTDAPDAPGAQLIRRVASGDDVERYVAASRSSRGRGGMASKLLTARSIAAQGRRVVIANGRRENILQDVMTPDTLTPFTEFV